MAIPVADKNSTHLAGEYFVAAELYRRGYSVAMTLGNAKAIDLFAEHEARTGARHSPRFPCATRKKYDYVDAIQPHRGHPSVGPRLRAVGAVRVARDFSPRPSRARGRRRVSDNHARSVAEPRSHSRGGDGPGSAAGDAPFDRVRVQLVAKLGIPEYQYQEQNQERQIAVKQSRTQGGESPQPSIAMRRADIALQDSP